MSKRGFSASRKGLIGPRHDAFSYVAVNALAANPLNPRLHNHQQVAAIARSIETFGFNAPILIDGENHVVAGHGRLEAAKWLKLERVPVIRLAHLTEAQAKAYMLADNKLTDRSSWDDRADCRTRPGDPTRLASPNHQDGRIGSLKIMMLKSAVPATRPRLAHLIKTPSQVKLRKSVDVRSHGCGAVIFTSSRVFLLWITT